VEEEKNDEKLRASANEAVCLLGLILGVLLMWIGGAFAPGGFIDQLLGGR